MKCLHPIELRGKFVPCGCCLNCRINETTSWSIRALFELHDFDTASFVTLTYEDSQLPANSSLCKDQLQEFMDNLQHKVKREKGIKLRFFAAGEYSDPPKQRPHYHAILYGLNPDPFDSKNHDRQLIIDTWKKCDKHIFDWNRYDYNKNAINFVNRETCQYVAGYIQKNLNLFKDNITKITVLNHLSK